MSKVVGETDEVGAGVPIVEIAVGIGLDGDGVTTAMGWAQLPASSTAASASGIRIDDNRRPSDQSSERSNRPERLVCSSRTMQRGSSESNSFGSVGERGFEPLIG